MTGSHGLLALTHHAVSYTLRVTFLRTWDFALYFAFCHKKSVEPPRLSLSNRAGEILEESQFAHFRWKLDQSLDCQWAEAKVNLVPNAMEVQRGLVAETTLDSRVAGPLAEFSDIISVKWEEVGFGDRPRFQSCSVLLVVRHIQTSDKYLCPFISLLLHWSSARIQNQPWHCLSWYH